MAKMKKHIIRRLQHGARHEYYYYRGVYVSYYETGTGGIAGIKGGALTDAVVKAYRKLVEPHGAPTVEQSEKEKADGLKWILSPHDSHIGDNLLGAIDRAHEEMLKANGDEDSVSI